MTWLHTCMWQPHLAHARAVPKIRQPQFKAYIGQKLSHVAFSSINFIKFISTPTCTLWRYKEMCTQLYKVKPYQAVWFTTHLSSMSGLPLFPCFVSMLSWIVTINDKACSCCDCRPHVYKLWGTEGGAYAWGELNIWANAPPHYAKEAGRGGGIFLGTYGIRVAWVRACNSKTSL